jgi:predicted nucleic acid-binding protein
MSVVEVRSTVVRRVPALVMRQPLRGYDAVQLAAALAVQDRGTTVDFWTADTRLAEAAQRENLRATLVS